MSDVLSPYPSPERRDSALQYLAGRLNAEMVDYGQSVEGRPLWAVRLPTPTPDAPRVLVCANIHGVEFIGNRVAHGVLEALIDHPLRERAEVWVAPCLNPDGYAATWALGGQAPLRRLRKNANGVDLNRNFPMPWSASPAAIPFAGATTPTSATYRGVAPASEPEVRHLVDLMNQIQPHAGVNLHSFMGTLIQPRVRHLADHQTYGRLIGATRAAQPQWRYTRLAFPPLDVFTGEQEDYQHHVLQCWAICLECFPIPASWQQHWTAPSVFWRFNPRAPGKWVDNDVPGVLSFLTEALQIKRPPQRPGADQSRSAW